MRIRFSLIVLLTASTVLAQTAPSAKGPALPKGVELLLPKAQGVKALWLMPSARKGPKPMAFDVDPKGDPWLGYGGRTILNPAVLGMTAVDRPFQDFAWLDSGEFLVSDGKNLGYLIGVRRKGAKDRAVRSVFTPAIALPYKGFRLFSGGFKDIYLAGLSPETRRGEIFRLRIRNKKAAVTKVFEVPHAVSFVAGEGDILYAAVNRAVVKLDLRAKTSEAVFVHPSEPVTELAYDPLAGLFYATPTGVGFVRDGKGAQFLRGPRPRLRLKKDSLYILLDNGDGLLKITGARKFKDAGKKP